MSFDFFNKKEEKKKDFEVQNSPYDSVSNLVWAANDFLIASSWDCTVSTYQVVRQNAIQSKIVSQIKHKAPVLTVDAYENMIFSGGCDNEGLAFKLGSTSTTTFAKHDAPIKTLHYLPNLQVVVTGSWDKTIRYWDIRQSKQAGQIKLDERVFSASAKDNLYVVATSDNKFLLYDIRKYSEVLKKYDSLLKHQTRTVQLLTDLKGFCIGSVEGRIGVQFFVDGKLKNEKSFPFKCHRVDDNVYAVNDIKAHPQYSVFASVGSDGSYHFWDKDSRTRLLKTEATGSPITCCAFNKEGTLFSYAKCYDFSKGPEYYKKEEQTHILIHENTKEEVTPKKN